ncbi:hypothetical protein EBME_0109 [bacterium endosymbiont of Mortierella elongata FMR23-6]|nr:hypothetical protein EBME_0109 [bacterium endosymbiont of Mortierella elongata FMR23-6]
MLCGKLYEVFISCRFFWSVVRDVAVTDTRTSTAFGNGLAWDREGDYVEHFFV